MHIKDNIIKMLKAEHDEEVLKEIYLILQESEKEIKLNESQLKRIDIAEQQIKYGKVISHDDVIKKHFSGE